MSEPVSEVKTAETKEARRLAILSSRGRREEGEGYEEKPLRLPEWVKRSVLNTEENRETRTILKEQKLNTICESGRCPNKGECWAKGTATFMLMGALCTRTCRFCAVNKGTPSPLDEDEPARIAEASKQMGLRHVVLTSVNRDDLPDQGANHFARTITAIKDAIPGVAVEVLTPDFQGRQECLEIVLAAEPVVYNHNVETVPRLYKQVRPGSKYDRSLNILKMAKEKDLIRLEKEIKSKMVQIKNKKMTPAESGIGRLLNLMKSFDEPLFDKLMNEYKKILVDIKN
jgi:lipoate synthase